MTCLDTGRPTVLVCFKLATASLSKLIYKQRIINHITSWWSCCAGDISRFCMRVIDKL